MAKVKMSGPKPINKNTGKNCREKYNYNASVVKNSKMYGPDTGYGKTVFGARSGK